MSLRDEPGTLSSMRLVVRLFSVLILFSGCVDNPDPGTRRDSGMDVSTEADTSTGDCGEVNQACCTSGRRCESGSICDPSGMCCATTNGASCGSPDDCCGTLDCLGGECCAVTGQACRTSSECCGSATCENMVCAAPSSDCGGERQPCCADDSCQDGFACASGMCISCGGDGESCCREGTPCEENLVCNATGMCEAAGMDCGMEGQACCTGASCTGMLVCTAGMCEQPPEGCVATACGACVGTAGGICGWCGDSDTCMEGDMTGPSMGMCASGWEFGASADCSTAPDPCTMHMDCGDCTRDGTNRCGWCSNTNSCSRGAASGPDNGACSGADWLWLPSECSGMMMMNDCSVNTDCDSCVRDTDLLPFCGWCTAGATPTCLPGTGSGSTDGTCSGADWNYTFASCSAGMCSMQGASCTMMSECCTGLSCRANLSLGTNCCREAGESCMMGNECCGFMDCVGGTCTCRAAGRACLDNADCCSMTCSGGVCT